MKKILLIGCGHMGEALLSSWINSNKYSIKVIDPYKYKSLKQKYKSRNIKILKSISALDKYLELDFIVVATRGHRYDNTALLAAANTSAKYVGLMGSKRKTILIYEDLLRENLSVERLREIRSPIGLDIKARTPEEIAMSIMSEVLMFRLGGTGAPMKLEEKLLEKIIEKVSTSTEKSVFSV